MIAASGCTALVFGRRCRSSTARRWVASSSSSSSLFSMDGMAPTEVISSTIPDASVTAAGTANNINTTHQTKQPPPRKSSVVFYWFRLGDLRLSDNQGLTHAAKLAAPPKPKKIKTDKSKKGKAKINKLPPDAAALWSAIHQSDGLSLMSRPQDDAALKNTLQTDIQIIDSSTTTIVDEPSGKDAKAAAASALVPIFCFEPGIFGANALSRDWKHLRCHARRAQFIVESVADLREQWQKRQPTKQENTSAAASDDDDDAVPPLVSPFLVAHGEPAEIFDQLLHQLRTAAGGDEFLNVRIVCQDEPAFEERAAVESVSRVLKKHMAREASSCSDGDEENVPVATEAEVKAIWGSYLFSGKGLTNGARSKINPSSDLLSRFTIDVNKKHKTKDLKLLPSPDFNPTPIPVKSPMIEAMATFMPTLQDLGYTQEQILAARVDRRAAMIFPGGETAAMARIHDYIWVQKNLRDFGETRFGLIGQEYSSKFSPWLSHGCVSPRFIALEVKKHARLNRKFHESCCYISKVPLVQRDFCRYYTARHGNEIFQLNGPLVRKKLLKNKSTFAKPLSKKAIWKATSPTPMPHSETERFTAWTDGQTGYPFIDACMRELKYTGYMSLRGRMNVASFLVFDLKVDWRRGAEWFEYQLIDYEVCSNWVNWLVTAGLSGTIACRYDVVHEGILFDPNEKFVRRWVPELRNLPAEFVHMPWMMTPSQQEEFQTRLGIDYPLPMITTDHIKDETRVQKLPRSSMKFTKEQCPVVITKEPAAALQLPVDVMADL